MQSTSSRPPAAILSHPGWAPKCKDMIKPVLPQRSSHPRECNSTTLPHQYHNWWYWPGTRDTRCTLTELCYGRPTPQGSSITSVSHQTSILTTRTAIIHHLSQDQTSTYNQSPSQQPPQIPWCRGRCNEQLMNHYFYTCVSVKNHPKLLIWLIWNNDRHLWIFQPWNIIQLPRALLTSSTKPRLSFFDGF